MTRIGKASRWFQLKSAGVKRGRTSANPPRTRAAALGVEALDDRLLLSGIPVTFQIAPDVATKGVYLSVFGQLQQAYQPSSGPLLPTNTYVYFDSAVNDYQAATTSTNLTFQLTGTSFDLPTPQIQGGQIVIGVASAPIVAYTGSGFATAKASTNPTNYFGLFEYSIDASGIDVDISEVDQLGFPFTVYSPDAPFPAQGGIGIARTRPKLFNFYDAYIGALPDAAQVFQQSLTYGAPYRILSPQDVLEAQEAVSVISATPGTGGSVPTGNWWYWVTGTNSYGETGPGLPTFASVTGGNNAVTLTWNAMWGATGYKIYRGASTDPTQASLVKTITTATTSSTDKAMQGTSGTPPRNSFTFNPLNSYFDKAIDDFFKAYEPTSINPTGKQFVFDRDGYTFKGYTNTSYKLTAGDPNTYTVLDLSPSSGPFQNEHFLIFKPHFKDNTSDNNAPWAPSWMPHKDQSPAAMILAADGVFNDGGAQPGVDAGTLSDLENSIVSAFNRGVATSLTSNNWAYAAPTLNAPAVPSSGGGLSPNTTYYYVVTAVDPSGNESTASIEVKATTDTTNRSVALSWLASGNPASYNVYRSQSPDTGWLLIYNVPNPVAPPAFGYTDLGTTPTTPQTPPNYYAPGSTSNWYSAFFHENSTADTVSGVSINGLAYGFPYDDQGNNASNIKVPISTSFIVTIQPWINLSAQGPSASLGAKPVPPTHPDAIMLLSQPSTVRIGETTNLSFEVLTAHGHQFFGGVTVSVTIAGLGRRTFSVQTDPLTGIGTITLDNRKLGYHVVQLTVANGPEAYSDVFQTVSTSTSNRVISALNSVNHSLNTNAFRSYLKRLR
ncbi:MAG: hypothetical protein HYX69_21575 [Planctomycetia bacterium]|nr:hypothetical protein [Planctomycetia bacterium]